MPNGLDIKQHTFQSAGFRKIVDEAIQFFERTPVCPLPPPGPFEGPGVYALYYTGDFPYYARIAVMNRTAFAMPIYAGKAVPEGWRTGRMLKQATRQLYRRLREHVRSIDQVESLNLSDFRCRLMVLTGEETNLITVVESELFRRYTPLWNTYIDGFGNHDPGKGRYNQAVSEWDALHPGRSWVSKLTGQTPSIADIIAKIPAHLLPSTLP